ncbi:protein gvpI [Natronomonas sp. LN261]|uniref:protein gvpI n=1 Tax=Natronomonas sp. LN261 TaxID=2750669 RepID=UPI0015EF6C6C
MTNKQQRQRSKKARQAQIKAQTNRDKARNKLLQQRKALARRRAENRKQCEKRRAEADDNKKNPTAHSTLPPQTSNAQNAARNSHSAVPAVPRYSTVTARERLYGLRLHRKTSENDDGPVSGDEPADGGVSSGE